MSDALLLEMKGTDVCIAREHHMTLAASHHSDEAGMLGRNVNEGNIRWSNTIHFHTFKCEIALVLDL